jgi:hypothetical protein
MAAGGQPNPLLHRINNALYLPNSAAHQADLQLAAGVGAIRAAGCGHHRGGNIFDAHIPVSQLQAGQDGAQPVNSKEAAISKQGG